MDVINIALFCIFTALQIADGFTTYRALGKPGNVESYRIPAHVMSAIGVIPGLIVLKGGIVIIMGAALWYASSVYLTAGMALLIVHYTRVCLQNYRLS